MNDNNLNLRIQWHQPDAVFAAIFLRDGEPWFLNGALVGIGFTRGHATDELMDLAAYLVKNGTNALLDGELSLEDRMWLFDHLDWGGQQYPIDDGDEVITNDDMYRAVEDERRRQLRERRSTTNT